MSFSEAVKKYITEGKVGRLATANPSGRPHVVPICYVYLGGFIYSAIDAKPKRVEAGRLKRVRNVLSNPWVCLVIDTYSEEWQNLSYVMIHGRATLLTGGGEYLQALNALKAKYPQYQEMAFMEENPVIKIEPRRITRWGAV